MMIVIPFDQVIVFMNLRLSKSTVGYSIVFSRSSAVSLIASGAPVTMILILKSFPTLTSTGATRMKSARWMSTSFSLNRIKVPIRRQSPA